VIIRDGIRIGNISDVGQERSENEDYFAYYEPDQDDHFQRKGRLTIVADGMGGMAGGYAASRIAVEEIMDQYTGHPAEDPREALKYSIEEANAAIQRRQAEDPSYKGMGTTATAMVLKDGYAYFAQVGDSRAYLIRQGAPIQLTEDQTKVRRMLDEGILTEEEAEDHPDAHILSQAVGHKESVDVDISIAPLETQPGDKLLLCSDGLHGQVSDQEMADIISSNEPNEACRILVDLANQRGGPDNITVQIIEIVSDCASTAVPPRPLRPPSPTVRDIPRTVDEPGGNLLIKIIIGLLLVGLGAGITMFIYSGKDKKEEHDVDVVTHPPPKDDSLSVNDDYKLVEDEKEKGQELKKKVNQTSKRAKPGINTYLRNLNIKKDAKKRKEAVEKLCKSKNKALLPKLIKALKQASLQKGALQVLKCLGPKAEAAIAELRSQLNQTNDPYFIKEIIRVLGGLGSKAKQAFPEISKALEKTKKTYVKKAAITALAQVGPKDPRVHAILKDVLCKKGVCQTTLDELNKIEQFKVILNKTRSQNSKCHCAYFGLGTLALMQKKFDVAEKHLNKAVSLNPGNLEYQLLLGEVYERWGKKKKACEIYIKVSKIKPNNSQVTEGLRHLKCSSIKPILLKNNLSKVPKPPTK